MLNDVSHRFPIHVDLPVVAQCAIDWEVFLSPATKIGSHPGRAELDSVSKTALHLQAGVDVFYHVRSVVAQHVLKLGAALFALVSATPSLADMAPVTMVMIKDSGGDLVKGTGTIEIRKPSQAAPEWLDFTGHPIDLPRGTLMRIVPGFSVVLKSNDSATTYISEGEGPTIIMILPEAEEGYLKLQQGTVLVSTRKPSGVSTGMVRLRSEMTRYEVRVSGSIENPIVECLNYDGVVVVTWDDGSTREIGPLLRWNTELGQNLPLVPVVGQELLKAIEGFLSADRAESLQRGQEVEPLASLMASYQQSFPEVTSDQPSTAFAPAARIEQSSWALDQSLAQEAYYQSTEAQRSWVREQDTQRAAYANLYTAAALNLVGQTESSIQLSDEALRILVPEGQSIPDWFVPDEALLRYLPISNGQRSILIETDVDTVNVLGRPRDGNLPFESTTPVQSPETESSIQLRNEALRILVPEGQSIPDRFVPDEALLRRYLLFSNGQRSILTETDVDTVNVLDRPRDGNLPFESTTPIQSPWRNPSTRGAIFDELQRRQLGGERMDFP